MTSSDLPAAYQYRPNLALRIRQCRQARRQQTIVETIAGRDACPTLILCLYAHEADELANALSGMGRDALVCHAGHLQEQSRKTTARFLHAESPILVATQGAHFPPTRNDLHALYVATLPASTSALVQTLRVTGQDGLPAVVDLFPSHADAIALDNLERAERIPSSLLEKILDQIPPHTGVADVPSLALAYDIRPALLRELLTTLAPLPRPHHMAKAKQWLHTRSIQRKAAVREMLSFVESPGCITQRLASHCGVNMHRPCGHCGWCMGLRPGLLAPELQSAPALPQIHAALHTLATSHRGALATRRQRAAFLAGLPLPRAQRAGLTHSPLFASLGYHPHETIRAAVEIE